MLTKSAIAKAMADAGEPITDEQAADVAEKAAVVEAAGRKHVFSDDERARSAASRRVDPEGRTTRLIVSLSQEDRDALDTFAQAHGVSLAQAVRVLIRDEVARNLGAKP